MGRAPHGITSFGRFNHTGNNYYYFSNQQRGAIEEVRKHSPKCKVQVAKLKTKGKVKMVDISQRDENTFLKYCRFPFDPQSNKNVPREYLIPSFFTDCCKMKGYDGMALTAKRYAIKNGNDPTPGNITEEKESELEEFIDNAKIVMGTIGHKMFEPLTEVKYPIELNNGTKNESNELLLHLKRKSRKSGQTIEADCKRTIEGFVVLKGSHIELKNSDSIPPGIKEAR